MRVEPAAGDGCGTKQWASVRVTQRLVRPLLLVAASLTFAPSGTPNTMSVVLAVAPFHSSLSMMWGKTSL